MGSSDRWAVGLLGVGLGRWALGLLVLPEGPASRRRPGLIQMKEAHLNPESGALSLALAKFKIREGKPGSRNEKERGLWPGSQPSLGCRPFRDDSRVEKGPLVHGGGKYGALFLSWVPE